jgi:hypothetical protein
LLETVGDGIRNEPRAQSIHVPVTPGLHRWQLIGADLTNLDTSASSCPVSQRTAKVFSRSGNMAFVDSKSLG